jgi:cell division septum initiation protein DivIVA
MSDQTDYHADPNHEDLFEREMRGYSRRRVDEFVAKTRSQIRDLEDRLSQAQNDTERLRLEVAAVREAAAEKPAHEEISERIGQILKLADDESKAQRTRADEEINKLREDARLDTIKLREEAKADTDKTRAEAHEQAERMLSAAQEQAESTVATATAESDQARKSARAEAERAVSEATKQAESAVSTAKAQAKQQLDEATARASAIHDGAERRLNLLTSRHTEAIRRLTEIRDVVTTLVAGEAARGSLEEEVARAVAAAAESNNGTQAPVGNGGRPATPADTRRAAAGVPAQPPAPAAPAVAPAAPVPATASAELPAAQRFAQASPAGAAPAVAPVVVGKPTGSNVRTTSARASGGGQHEAARHAAGSSRNDGEDTAESLRSARE